ncbi:MAG: histidine phosphatase family protein [Nocardioides sp.]
MTPFAPRNPTILVVRHAEPAVSPAVDPNAWQLSEAGRDAATQLGQRLPRDGRWVASTERKAYETLLYVGHSSVTVRQDSRFDEVRRNEPFDDDFKTRRRAWVEGRLDVRHSGWESPHEAAERFEDAVHDHSADAEYLVVGTHGMVLTAWLLHARQQLEPSEAGSFWEHMTFPDIIRVS